MQLSDQRIHMPDCLSNLRTAGAIIVSGMVYVRAVERNEVRTLVYRKLKPGDHLFNAPLIGKPVIEMQVIAWPHILDCGFRPRPEEAGRTHALFLSQYPERRAAIPAAIAVCLRIFVGIALLPLLVIEVIG